MPYINPKLRKEYNTAYQRKWRAENPDVIRRIAKKHYAKNVEKILKRGADWREKKRMELATRKRSLNCEICQKECRTVLDHDHITGKFRGWICSHCNSALGHALDSPSILLKLRDYLIANQATPQ